MWPANLGNFGNQTLGVCVHEDYLSPYIWGGKNKTNEQTKKILNNKHPM